MPQQPPVPADSESSPSASPLAQALELNEAAQDVVERSAAELVIINAVLKQEIPGHVQTGDVAFALQKTDELETKIADTAEDLAQVNQALSHEIDQRVDLERELAETKVALAEALNSPDQGPSEG
jgi:hypothetical protein